MTLSRCLLRICPSAVAGVYLLGMAWAVLPARAAADISPEVRHALEKNAAALSPLMIAWDKLLNRPKEKSSDCIRAEYRYQDGMFHTRWPQKTSTGKDLGPEFLYDGKWFYNGTGVTKGFATFLNVQKPDILVKTMGDRSIVQPYDYFYTAGLAIPGSFGSVGVKPQSLVLLVQQGARSSDMRTEGANDGGEILVIDLVTHDRKHHFSLSPPMGYAILRHEERLLSGQLVTASENSEFVRLSDPELWLPKRTHAGMYFLEQLPGKFFPEPVELIDCVVKECKRERVPPEYFSGQHYMIPGVDIADGRPPGAEKAPDHLVHYRIPADPKDLEAAVRAAVEGKEFVPGGRRSLWWKVIGANVVLLVAVLVWRRIALRRAAAAR